jgi:hypothetical protein
MVRVAHFFGMLWFVALTTNGVCPFGLNGLFPILSQVQAISNSINNIHDPLTCKIFQHPKGFPFRFSMIVFIFTHICWCTIRSMSFLTPLDKLALNLLDITCHLFLLFFSGVHHV